MATSQNIQGHELVTVHSRHTCKRCGGLMLREGLFDLFDDTGQMRRWARRCVQCGDIVDSLILKRRMGAELPALKLLSRRRWTGVEALVRKPLHG